MADNLYKPKDSNYWHFRVEIRGKEHTGSLATTSRTVAEKRRNARIRELRQALDVGRLSVTFVTAANKFYDVLESGTDFTWSPKTCTRYRVSMQQITKTLLEALDEDGRDLLRLEVRDIDVPLISEMVRLRKKKASVATVNRDLTAFGHFLTFCQTEYQLETNPLRLFTKMGMKETLPPITLPKDDAFERIVARGPETFGCLLRFIDWEGTRAEETALIEWQDVEFHRTDPTRATVLLRKTKGNRPRVIELDPKTVAMLRQMRRSNRWPFVFFNTGKHGWYSDLSTRFWEYAEDVEFGARLHDLRHRFAIRKLKGDWSIYRVSRHLGHRSVLTTERYYLRYLTQEEQEAAQQRAGNGPGAWTP